MRSFHWIAALVLIVGTALFIGCNSKLASPAAPPSEEAQAKGIATSPGLAAPLDPLATVSPTGSLTPDPSQTVTPSPTPQGIFLWNAVIYRENEQDSVNMTAVVDLQVDGVPVTNAGLTVTGPDGPHGLVCTGFIHSTPKGPAAFYYLPGKVPYQAGATYTFSASTSEGVASFTGVAPGGSLKISADGSLVTWAVEGAEDVVDVITAANNQSIYSAFGAGVDSPFSIPASVYSGYSSPTTFKVEAVIQNDYNWVNVVPGNGYARIEDGLIQNVVLPFMTSTPTPTTTATGTPTFTPTVTNTPTITPTPYPTPTLYHFLSKWGTGGKDGGQFNWPAGVAVNKTTNRVYVVDMNNNRVQYFDANGNYQGQWGSKGANQGQFSSPQGIAVDSQGYVFVADTGNRRFQVFDASGYYLTQYSNVGPGTGQLNYPLGITVESLNNGTTIDNVYVSDQANKRVEKFQFNKFAFLNYYYVNFTAQWPAQFQDPDGCRSIAFNGSSIYLSEHQLIEQFDTNGHYLYGWKVSPSAVAINGIVVDAKGTLLESQTDDWVAEYCLKDFYYSILGKQGTDDGQFSEPAGMAVDGGGNLYICDQFNNRVQKFAPNN